MRLDKYVSDAVICTRSEADRLIKTGKITVDGRVIKKPDHKVTEKNEVFCNGSMLHYSEFIYIMMNKPQGVISATDDPKNIEKTVLSLLPENYLTKGLFPAGRLDKDTVGLLVLTNDGKTAHRLLSPKSHVEKTYYVECDGDFVPEDIETCKKGVILDGELTKPCILTIDEEKKNCGTMVLTEGKYHEIKRICNHLGKNVTFLERITFGPLTIDRSLARGEFRHLTAEEVAALLS